MLINLLEQRKTAILKKWFALTIETYPTDTTKFLKSQKDPFANPVGRTIYRGLEALMDELLKEMDYEKLVSSLDPIIRIRAIQNFSPSQAIGFIFFLKNVIRESFHHEMVEKEIVNELMLFESKIDEIVLMAFNLYIQCKEKLYELKANELKNRTLKVFERAGMIGELPPDEPDSEPITNKNIK